MPASPYLAIIAAGALVLFSALGAIIFLIWHAL
jgi:hypothetical protein